MGHKLLNRILLFKLQLMIRAADSRYTASFSIVTININVARNLNKPVFTYQYYRASVWQNAVVGRAIQFSHPQNVSRVEATEKDGEVGGDCYQQRFCYFVSRVALCFRSRPSVTMLLVRTTPCHTSMRRSCPVE